MLKPWKKISTEIVHENKFVTFRHDEFDLPNGVNADYYYFDISDAVTIIAVDEFGKLLIVNQYRPLFEQIVSEFPAGGIKNGQTPEEAADLELREEANVRAENYEYMGKFQSSNARTNEWMHVFVAHELSESSAPKDETEEFEHERWSVEDLESKIADGEFVDGICLAAWTLAKPKILALIDSQS